MKSLLSSALRRNGQAFAAILLLGFVIIGCKKENNQVADEVQSRNSALLVAESNLFGDDLSLQTIWELQQAKIATAKYNSFSKAIRDGYVDINVIVPEMGYHYLKMDHLDETFEYDKPEILVYSREENGQMKLVALEYAVPISLSPEAPPGFTGNSDHWAVYQGTLWTLHAWLWEPNPNGVFNPTNPNVHLH
jgi:hypothetical protein